MLILCKRVFSAASFTSLGEPTSAKTAQASSGGERERDRRRYTSRVYLLPSKSGNASVHASDFVWLCRICGKKPAPAPLILPFAGERCQWGASATFFIAVDVCSLVLLYMMRPPASPPHPHTFSSAYPLFPLPYKARDYM